MAGAAYERATNAILFFRVRILIFGLFFGILFRCGAVQRVRQDTAVSATFGLQGPLQTYVRPLPMDAFEHPIEAINRIHI